MFYIPLWSNYVQLMCLPGPVHIDFLLSLGEWSDSEVDILVYNAREAFYVISGNNNL